jgi:hypothetical protein
MYELANLIVCVLVPPAIDVRGATEGARAGDSRIVDSRLPGPDDDQRGGE